MSALQMKLESLLREPVVGAKSEWELQNAIKMRLEENGFRVEERLKTYRNRHGQETRGHIDLLVSLTEKELLLIELKFSEHLLLRDRKRNFHPAVRNPWGGRRKFKRWCKFRNEYLEDIIEPLDRKWEKTRVQLNAYRNSLERYRWVVQEKRPKIYSAMLFQFANQVFFFLHLQNSDVPATANPFPHDGVKIRRELKTPHRANPEEHLSFNLKGAERRDEDEAIWDGPVEFWYEGNLLSRFE